MNFILLVNKTARLKDLKQKCKWSKSNLKIPKIHQTTVVLQTGMGTLLNIKKVTLYRIKKIKRIRK